ncbi:reverse transcriptase domain-containing protein [Sphingobacterium bambusae]|uniref:Reverse transcriptase domain-containing protein n=1 Tax=Sphingobacterium bambusae TaxID=662858 RepID=A0ABW6BMM0_9SPHI|nr:reverse transcriptase domain-containing protein [Sphingobacterium bambusae]WPL46712.1 reverse transcriptase domain-containing protein [Sphingobacterium bambusae]
MKRKPDWLQGKGYMHITPSLSVNTNWKDYYRKITSPKYVATYAFFPLIHRILSDRKYKKADPKRHHVKVPKSRGHSHKRLDGTGTDKSIKNRPLHYSSHFDSLIYSYYAHLLGSAYESKLKEDWELDKAVLAYRSIPISETDRSGKSNIHFAHEVFAEINDRVESQGDVAVLAIDLKSFFSTLHHEILYDIWAYAINEKILPPDHYNVYKSCTNFSYILYNDLKKKGSRNFDESKLAKIRRNKGFKCFFESNQEFRKTIREGQLRIYKNPFRGDRNESGRNEMIGIPQGLPLSAILANLYLIEFDRTIVNEISRKLGAHYRRYSDDILILCKPEEMSYVDDFVNELILSFKVKISKEKTERFLFKKMVYNKAGDKRTTAIKLLNDKTLIDSPLNYLGFEFRGYNTLIKSTNIAKYYRRVIEIIKRRSRRAVRLSASNPTIPRAVYLNQVKKLYNSPLKHANKIENKQLFRRRYSLVIDDRGDFIFHHTDVEAKQPSNYLTYIKRCKKQFETNSFSRQLKKKKQIIGQAINKHLVNKRW